jgi:hypothetical protein
MTPWRNIRYAEPALAVGYRAATRAAPGVSAIGARPASRRRRAGRTTHVGSTGSPSALVSTPNSSDIVFEPGGQKAPFRLAIRRRYAGEEEPDRPDFPCRACVKSTLLRPVSEDGLPPEIAA